MWTRYQDLIVIGVLALVAVVFGLLQSRSRPRRDEPEGAGTAEERQRQEISRATVRISRSILGFAGAGALAMLVTFLKKDAGWPEVLASSGFVLLVGAAGGVVGGLLGFLFGIPRTVEAARAVEASAEADAAPLTRGAAALAANTNLERISDWLTTLLIGATLVQLNELPGWLKSVGEYATATPQKAMVPFALVYFFGLGFLGVYLITRLYLTSALFQTLDYLTGAVQEEQPPATLEDAKTLLESALRGSDEAATSGLERFESTPLSTRIRSDPELNALYARLLARYRNVVTVDPDQGTHDHQLIAAVTAAATDPAVKAQLIAVKDTELTTGDAALNQAIADALA